MNLFALLGPHTPASACTAEMLGGPWQRILESYYSLTTAIFVADKYSDQTKVDRLLKFKAIWEVRALMIRQYPMVATSSDPSADERAIELKAQVDAALAVVD